MDNAFFMTKARRLRRLSSCWRCGLVYQFVMGSFLDIRPDRLDAFARHRRGGFDHGGVDSFRIIAVVGLNAIADGVRQTIGPDDMLRQQSPWTRQQGKFV